MLKFNPKRRHSAAYYFSVLRIVIPALVVGRKQPEIRSLLTSQGITSPTGGEWTEAALAGVIARIRERKGYFYQALLEMFLANEFTRQDVSIILRSR